jgi:hypothetical protein
MPEPRWVCEKCGIFFGRHKDWAVHYYDHHYEPDPDLIERIEKMIERLRSMRER